MALVIGNQAYPWKPLVNPANDARAVAQTLEQVGFARSDIRVVIDARQSDLRRSTREFIEAVKPGDLAFVYYSGHGVEVKGNNYMLPVDLPRDATEGYVEDETVSVQRVLRDLNDHGARVRVLILDACRDNPLRAAKSLGDGLAPMEGRGSLIVFATEAGQTASDNPGGSNGLFTRYLIEGLRAPGVSLDDAMKSVSREVAHATGEKQVPAIYGLLLEDIVLTPGERRSGGTPARRTEPEDDSRLTPRQREFAHGVGPFRLGMTPTEVNAALPIQLGGIEWPSLPVASEYHNAEVRYFWRPVTDWPAKPGSGGPFGSLSALAPCWNGQSYVTFLFLDQRLFRISIRMLPDCQNRVDLLRQIAVELGIRNFDASKETPFEVNLPQTTVTGFLSRDATFNGAAFLEVFANSAPRPTW